MILPAGVSELRQAFHTHLGASGQIKGICSHLLLFYAAECGIKSIWLRRNKLKTINDIADQTLISQDGHNLDTWIKELKISAIVGTPPHFRLDRGGSSLDVEKAHQAWRYNIRMNPQDEAALVQWLENLCNWIKGEI